MVEFFIVFKKDDPKPYEPKGFIPVDLSENSVSLLINNNPILLETNAKRITLGYGYRRKSITAGRTTKDRDVRRKLAKLIVKEAFEGRSAIILEDLPKRVPEHMVKDVKDKQLRLWIYRSAFSSMKNFIIENADPFVPTLSSQSFYVIMIECRD